MWRALSGAVGLVVVLLAALIVISPSPRSASANPLGGITAISAGDTSTCALTTSGAVTCWGNSYFRQGRDANPVSVPGQPGDAVAISAGPNQVCIIRATGAMVCSGYDGQLGPIPGLEQGITQVSPGYSFSCATTADGGAKCWGAGELGDGTSRNTPVPPVDVRGLTSGVVSVDVSIDYACALTLAGALKCWGSNQYGQLGDGTRNGRLAPVDVAGLESGVVAFATEMNRTCAVLGDGTVKCWGQDYGLTPVTVPGIEHAISIAGGLVHACVTTTTGGISCWGSNAVGQLGDGQVCGNTCSTPVSPVGLKSGVVAVSAGETYTCALTGEGQVKCWGSDAFGQLGNGLGSSTTPLDVAERDPKPTPTPTACPPAGCPTPPPRPALPQTGLDFSSAIDTNGDGIPDCGAGVDQREECSLQSGGTFSVIVNLNALPPGVPSYVGFDLMLASAGGIQAQGKWRSIWPDCVFEAQSPPDEIGTLFGCATGIGQPASSYAGALASLDFVCHGNGSVTLLHGDGNTDLIYPANNPDGQTTVNEAPSGGETLGVSCGPILHGDADCSGVVNTVDAQETLQYHARLLDWLDCPQQSDDNLDSLTNAIDAALTEQYDARLVDTLPPQQASP